LSSDSFPLNYFLTIQFPLLFEKAEFDSTITVAQIIVICIHIPRRVSLGLRREKTILLNILRAANESSRAELGLTQARLKKIRVEPSRAHETVRAEKPSSNSARYYSS
jgi:hypothetical protein